MLIVTYRAKPGKQNNFLTEVAESGILETIRMEDGCLAYQYYQSVEDEACLMLVEKWATEEQQHTHMEQPHIKLLAEIKARWIDQTSVERIYLEEGDPK